jgi:hypothetical protein
MHKFHKQQILKGLRNKLMENMLMVVLLTLVLLMKQPLDQLPTLLVHLLKKNCGAATAPGL